MGKSEAWGVCLVPPAATYQTDVIIFLLCLIHLLRDFSHSLCENARA